MSEPYLSIAEAQAVYAEKHGLNDLPEAERVALTPIFPPGTREYAEYAEKMRMELASWSEWMEANR